MNVGAVRLDGTKMAKSTGNPVLVCDLLRDVPGPHCGCSCLPSLVPAVGLRPRRPRLRRSQLEALYSGAGRTSTSISGVEAVRAALPDDLDVPAALAVAHDGGGEAARLLIRTLTLA